MIISSLKNQGKLRSRIVNLDCSIDNSCLDLHGVKHHDVDRKVENFVLLNKTPLKVITGRSQRMRNLVTDVLERHDFNYEIPKVNNGMIRVF